jgi:hypothetical protein
MGLNLLCRVGGRGSSFGGTPFLVAVPSVLFLVTSYHLVMNTLLVQLAFIIVALLLYKFPHLIKKKKKVSPSVGRLAADQPGYDISSSSSICYPCNMLKIPSVGCVAADQP